MPEIKKGPDHFLVRAFLSLLSKPLSRADFDRSFDLPTGDPAVSVRNGWMDRYPASQMGLVEAESDLLADHGDPKVASPGLAGLYGLYQVPYLMHGAAPRRCLLNRHRIQCIRRPIPAPHLYGFAIVDDADDPVGADQFALWRSVRLRWCWPCDRTR